MSDTDADNGTIARLASQRTKYRDAARNAVRQNKVAAARIAELETQLSAATKADGSGRVKELEGQLRTLRHRGTFDRLALARGAAAEDLDDLFTISGYRAEADDPDEKAIGRLLDDAKEHPSRKKYFNAPAESDDDGDGRADEEPAPKKPAPADAGRGKRGDGKTVFITQEQLADPKWALDPRNAEVKRTAKIKA